MELDDNEKKKIKNEAAKKYYAANKQKILAQRKNKKISEKSSECKNVGLPEYLGKYITFAVDETITLRFETVDELRRVLYWMKFKSDYDENIRFAPKPENEELEKDEKKE